MSEWPQFELSPYRRDGDAGRRSVSYVQRDALLNATQHSRDGDWIMRLNDRWIRFHHASLLPDGGNSISTLQGPGHLVCDVERASVVECSNGGVLATGSLSQGSWG